MKRIVVIAALVVVAGACTNNEPVYIQAPNHIEVGVGSASNADVGTDTLNLPYDQPFLTSADYTKRQADKLASINATFKPPITAAQLPYVTLDQTAVSIEWTVKNLDNSDGQAFIDVNGGNQFFYYVPTDFIVVDPNNQNNKEAPPPLAGHIPISVPAMGTVSGVFREDELREAALDLDLITRCLQSPFAAMLDDNSKIKSCADVAFVPVNPDPNNPPAPPPPLPIEAFAQFVRLDLTFQATGHMVMEYAVRVRDPDGVLHTDLLAAPPGELMQFNPVEYIPPALPAP